MNDLYPVFITFHAEPDGLYLDKSESAPWHGFEKTYEFIQGMRAESLIDHLNFVWLVRADPQVEIVYKDLSWGIKKYAQEFEELEANGDELGLHVHPYRLKGEGFEWVQDFSDPKWVSHCVTEGFNAFKDFYKKKPLSLAIGPNSTDSEIVEACRSLGIKYDFTLSRNGKKAFNQIPGEVRGKMNWVKDLPGYPYTPKASDIAKESIDEDDYFLIPVPYFTFPHHLLNWKGIKRFLLRQSDHRRLKPSLSMHPKRFRKLFTLMKEEGMQYMLIDTRTHVFTQPKAQENIRTNLQLLQEMNGKSISIVTPSSGVCEKWSQSRRPKAVNA